MGGRGPRERHRAQARRTGGGAPARGEIAARTQTEERLRISRDLHDMVLQDLSGALQSLTLVHLRAKDAGTSLDLGEE